MKKTIENISIALLIGLAVVLLTSDLMAQGFTAAVSKNRVAVGEPFQIEFAVSNGGADNFKPPAALKDFDIYSGPNHSNSVQIINGSMSQSTSISYYIAAKREGKITIGPASITVNGNKKESNSITIEVSKASSGNPNAGNQGGNQGNAAAAQSSDENLFARTSVNRTKVYQGEQITVVHKIYTRLSLRGFQDVKFPTYNGFWSQDAPQKGQITLSNENIEGVNYSVAELRRTFLFPQRSGTLEIDPINVECVVRQRSRQPQNVFDQFFGTGGYEDVLMKAKSKPVKIEVMPLPETNKPENFSGAVGNFTFKASMNKNKVKTNEAVNLSISISGSGNLKLIDEVKVNVPEDIEKYDPKINDNISANNSGVSGSKSFEYLLIPRHAGEYKIDQVSFSYFDPDKKTYITLPSPEFSINVEKGKDDDNTSPAVMTTIQKKDVAVVGNDIRYIKTNNIQLKKKDNGFWGSRGFYGGLLSPMLLFAAFILVRRKNIKDNSDLVLVKSRKAGKMAKKRLVQAEKHLKENNKEPFYEEIFKALYGYLSDRLNIPFAELTKESISAMLRSKKVNDETCQKLETILSNCEFARYAPSSVSGDLHGAYNDSATIITQIEDQLS
ncbi:MAG: protein BatD [Bacteroidetes bacterium]|nr:protein BatD [Bacteroidota bacterium]